MLRTRTLDPMRDGWTLDSPLTPQQWPFKPRVLTKVLPTWYVQFLSPVCESGKTSAQSFSQTSTKTSQTTITRKRASSFTNIKNLWLVYPHHSTRLPQPCRGKRSLDTWFSPYSQQLVLWLLGMTSQEALILTCKMHLDQNLWTSSCSRSFTVSNIPATSYTGQSQNIHSSSVDPSAPSPATDHNFPFSEDHLNKWT